MVKRSRLSVKRYYEIMKYASPIYCTRPTVQMPKLELEALLQVDAAVGTRDARIHERPTRTMEAVSVPR
jgi:predicted metal-dependent RNase